MRHDYWHENIKNTKQHLLAHFDQIKHELRQQNMKEIQE